MSDTRKLIIGIVMVFVGLALVLSSSTSILPYIGGAIGVVGAGIVVWALTRGNIH